MGKFTFWTFSNGRPIKVTIRMELENARQLINDGFVFSGIWESFTNCIYL